LAEAGLADVIFAVVVLDVVSLAAEAFAVVILPVESLAVVLAWALELVEVVDFEPDDPVVPVVDPDPDPDPDVTNMSTHVW